MNRIIQNWGNLLAQWHKWKHEIYNVHEDTNLWQLLLYQKEIITVKDRVLPTILTILIKSICIWVFLLFAFTLYTN